MKIHIIRSNDTLWDLVQKYNIPYERLLEANPEIQDPERLEVGTKIRIPSGKIPVSPSKKRVTEQENIPSNEGVEGFSNPDPNPYAWETESSWEDYESSSSATGFMPYHATEEEFEPAHLPPIGIEETQMVPPPIYPPPFFYYPYPFPLPMGPVFSDDLTRIKESSSLEY